MAAEGEGEGGDDNVKVLALHRLTAIEFTPPTPDKPTGLPDKVVSVVCMFANVTVPLIYVNKEQKFSVMILNGYNPEELNDYDFLKTVFDYATNGAIKDIWYFRFAPTWWDWRPIANGGDDWDHVSFTFKPSPTGEALDAV